MSNAKAELMEAIRRAGGLKSLRLGGKLILYCGENAAEVEANAVKEAIRTGVAIYWPSGVREFYEWSEIYPYQWHEDGNRLRHQLVRTVVQGSGEASKQVVRTAWKKMEEV